MLGRPHSRRSHSGAAGGIAAESKLKGGVYTVAGAEDDRGYALDLMRDLAARRGQSVDDDSAFTPQLQAAWDEAQRIVDKHWGALELLVKELISRHTLSGAEVRQLLGRVQSSSPMGTSGH